MLYAWHVSASTVELHIIRARIIDLKHFTRPQQLENGINNNGGDDTRSLQNARTRRCW